MDALSDKVATLMVGRTAASAKRVGTYIGPIPEGPEWHLATDKGQLTAFVDSHEPAVVRFTSCPELDRCLTARKQDAADRFALTVQHRTATAGQCRICGCTMSQACPDGCWWVDDTTTLCRQHDGF